MIINAGGGGLFPQLVISTEIGAVITATKGEQTLNKTADSETVIIDLPAYGTWTVTAVASGVTTTETVEVDTVMQYVIDLSAQLINYTMIYDEGNEHAEIHGGLTSSGYTRDGYSTRAGTKNASNITLTGSASNMTILGTTNLFDVTDYTKVFARANSIKYASNQGGLLYTHISKNISDTGGMYIDVPNKLSIVSLDLTSLTEKNRYFAMCVMGLRTCVFYNVFLVKADDYNTLADKAGITAPSNLAALIADTDSIRSILNSKAAVNFMIKQCTGDFMASFVQSAACLTALDASPYKATIQANEHWAKFLAMVA